MQTIEGQPGESIHQTAMRAIVVATRTGQEVLLECNGTTVRVYPGSHEYDITDKYFLSRALERSKG